MNEAHPLYVTGAVNAANEVHLIAMLDDVRPPFPKVGKSKNGKTGKTGKTGRKGKGKDGKGKGGKRAATFMATEEAQTFFKGKGKGMRNSSGKDPNTTRRNPIGRDGNIMKCSVCDSEWHFRAKCPRCRPGGNGGKGGFHFTSSAVEQNKFVHSPNGRHSQHTVFYTC